jgi:hypothetical protein
MFMSLRQIPFADIIAAIVLAIVVTLASTLATNFAGIAVAADRSS